MSGIECKCTVLRLSSPGKKDWIRFLVNCCLCTAGTVDVLFVQPFPVVTPHSALGVMPILLSTAL